MRGVTNASVMVVIRSRPRQMIARIGGSGESVFWSPLERACKGGGSGLEELAVVRWEVQCHWVSRV